MKKISYVLNGFLLLIISLLVFVNLNLEEKVKNKDETLEFVFIENESKLFQIKKDLVVRHLLDGSNTIYEGKERTRIVYYQKYFNDFGVSVSEEEAYDLLWVYFNTNPPTIRELDVCEKSFEKTKHLTCVLVLNKKFARGVIFQHQGKGYVLTAKHVIEENPKIVVWTSSVDMSEKDEVILRDHDVVFSLGETIHSHLDVSVVQVEGDVSMLPEMPNINTGVEKSSVYCHGNKYGYLSYSRLIKVPYLDSVYGVHYPFFGILAKNTESQSLLLLETDHGFSGSGLFNVRGELIGILSRGASGHFTVAVNGVIIEKFLSQNGIEK